MKSLFKAFAVLATALAIFSCNRNSVSDPMFWTWLEDIPGIDMESAFTHMEEAGLDAVMLHAPSVEAYKKDVEIAHRHGITVYAWVWTLNPPRQERAQMLEEHPDWFSVNRHGQSVADHKAYVNSYKFLCPALPEVREYLRSKVEQIVAVDGVEGICLDYCRLIDCVLPISLAYNYNLRQDTEVRPEYDYGYHPAMLEKFQAGFGYDPREKEDPSRDEVWCQFRCDQVTEVANMMCEIAHKAGKKVTASPFAAAGLAKFDRGHRDSSGTGKVRQEHDSFLRRIPRPVAIDQRVRLNLKVFGLIFIFRFRFFQFIVTLQPVFQFAVLDRKGVRFVDQKTAG